MNLLLVGISYGKNLYSFWENVDEDNLRVMIEYSDEVDGVRLLDDGYEFIYGDESEEKLKERMKRDYDKNFKLDFDKIDCEKDFDFSELKGWIDMDDDSM